MHVEEAAADAAAALACVARCQVEALVSEFAVHAGAAKVYGGNAELVPAEEAALKRLMQQERKQSQQAAKCKASRPEAAKSSRIASAGRAISRWSSSAWGVAKKPAVVRHHVMLFA